MNIRSLVVATNIGVAFLLGAGIAAQAAEVRVLSVYGMSAVMKEVGPKFEHATGHELVIEFATPLRIQERILDGETTDVVIVAGVDIAKGQVVPDSMIPVARGVLGVAVLKGAPKPDISTPDAVKRALLAAKSIASYTNSPSNVSLVKVIDSWGIADEMKRKIIIGGPPPRRVEDLVANGEAEIGVHVLAMLIGVPGIEIVGPLPDDFQTFNVSSAAIMTGATDMAAAKALIDFLRTPEAVSVIKAKGMAPAAL